MKKNDDEHACKEDPTKKYEANPQLMNKCNLLEKSHPADWLKDFLGNKLARTHKHGTEMQTT